MLGEIGETVAKLEAARDRLAARVAAAPNGKDGDLSARHDRLKRRVGQAIEEIDLILKSSEPGKAKR